MSKFVPLFVLLISFVLSGCSLFKVSFSTGEKPLDATERDMRVATRAFYNKFSTDVIASADSVFILTDNMEYKKRSVQWKLNSTSACASAVYQTSSSVSLVNLWVLTAQMQAMMTMTADAKLFGQYSEIARRRSSMLNAEVDNFAKTHLSRERYDKFSEFVNGYAKKNPIFDMNFTDNNLVLELLAFLDGDKSSINTSGGLISEVLSDMNDRVTGYSGQAFKEIGWGGELIKLDIQQDSSAIGLLTRADSLMITLRQMGVILNSSPELIDSISRRFGVDMTRMVVELNYGINGAFGNLSNERLELQKFIDSQRKVIMVETDTAVQNAIKTAMDAIPTMINKIIVYVVLAFLILFSIPFVLGYFLGRLRKRKSPKQE